MQYTGLKDKNGVEIYEGDTLAVWIGGYKQSAPYEVNNMLEFYFDCNTHDSYNRIQSCEVIGNLYETPELLNK